MDDRKLIEEFLDWLIGEGHTPPRFHSGQEAALDVFFGIDRSQLDRERRELLADFVASRSGDSLDHGTD